MARGVPVFLLLMPDEYEDSLTETIVHFRKVAQSVRERLLFAYGFKDTEPWPQFAQALGIPRDGVGAYWMIVGNGMDITGRDWRQAWLKPPSLGFQIYAMEVRQGCGRWGRGREEKRASSARHRRFEALLGGRTAVRTPPMSRRPTLPYLTLPYVTGARR